MRPALLLLFVGCGFAPGAASVHDGGPDAPPDSLLPPTCSDQIKNGNELDVDCGGSCPACTTVFATDPDTLARFELNGDVTDSSGNARDATLLGGTFVTTSWGKGLSVTGEDPQGFKWTSYAGLIVHPYTIEMVVTPDDTSCWKKLFGSNDAVDTGWNYCSQLQTYAPNYMVGPNLVAHQRHYFAMVSTSSTMIDVYLNGTMIGSVGAGFTAPPGDAIFFRDDSQTGRGEMLSGVIEAVRISKIARTPAEILKTATRLAQQP